mgnify:CR=1 FL=1
MRPSSEPPIICGLARATEKDIRIAGAKLAVKTHWSLREMVDRLTEEKRRLDELQAKAPTPQE